MRKFGRLIRSAEFFNYQPLIALRPNASFFYIFYFGFLMRYTALLYPFCFLLLNASHAWADVRSDVAALFAQDLTTIDIAQVKIKVDRMVDPAINIEHELVKIDAMVATIETMLPRGADDYTNLETIRRYIYEAGPWNNHKPFSYDHDDPYGLDVGNKLLADYMRDRRGNCITMPFLFIILGQRLGLDVHPALAPLHVYVRFTDESGVTKNIETTSGGYFARDAHYRNNLPITDVAVTNGVFMKTLNNEQTMAVIAVVLVEDLIRKKRYQEAIDVANEILKHYPKFAYAMVKKATAAYHLLTADYYSKYPNIEDVPADQHARLNYLQQINQRSFNKAESLGWKPLKR
jgi:regulator of sirC expression with transglutaminase-like and TPR domain